MQEEGTWDNAVRVKGATSPWFTGQGSDLLMVKVSLTRYWLGYSSGPRTDQQRYPDIYLVPLGSRTLMDGNFSPMVRSPVHLFERGIGKSLIL